MKKRIQITERHIAELRNLPIVPEEIKKKIDRFVTCRRYPCLDMQIEANELSKELKNWAYKNLSEEILTHVKSCVFEIAHRRCYGVKLKHLEDYFSEKNSATGKEDVDGLRWVWYGINNCRVPHGLLEVLNAIEIYSFYVGVWKLKQARDNKNKEESKINRMNSTNNRTGGIIQRNFLLEEKEKNEMGEELDEKQKGGIETGTSGFYAGGLAFAEKMLFSDLISSCIEVGIRTLRKCNLWNEDKIRADAESNPYSRAHSLKDRIAYACEISIERNEENIEKVVRKELSKPLRIPGYEFWVPLRKYRYKEDGRWEWASGGKIDKHRYATTIFDYFKKRESERFL
jgi:hypothetical protein